MLFADVLFSSFGPVNSFYKIIFAQIQKKTGVERQMHNKGRQIARPQHGEDWICCYNEPNLGN